MEKVISPLGFNNYQDLKRDILFFDKILFDPKLAKELIATYEWANNYDQYAKGIRLIENLEFDSTIEYLQSKGVLEKINLYNEFSTKLRATYVPNIELFEKLMSDYDFLYAFRKAFGELMLKKEHKGYILDCYAAANTYSNLAMRMYATIINNCEEVKDLSALSTRDPFTANKRKLFNSFFPDYNESKKHFNSVHLLINKVPIPDSSVPFDEILDWKQQDDNRLMFLRMKRWFAKSIDANISKKELEDELEYLTLEFENRMKLQKMKYRISNIEAICLAPLKITEDIIKFNWSKIPSSLASIKKNKIDLLISESEAPGKEIAYLSAIKKRFK